MKYPQNELLFLNTLTPLQNIASFNFLFTIKRQHFQRVIQYLNKQKHLCVAEQCSLNVAIT